jgi:hypothetical protein
MYLSGSNKKNSANIDTVNNQKVLIMYFEYKNDVYYQFLTVNKSNTAIIIGQIEFPLDERAKAKSILDDIVKNLKFRKD